MTNASSGFQSFVPLFLVTRNLANIIDGKKSETHKELSIEQEKKLRNEIDKLISNKKLTPDVKRLLLEQISSRFKYSSFINIVEEPEQNLYPETQKEALFSLLKTKNKNSKNRLILTTHSPYIINFLTLAIKAHSLKKATSNNEILSKINEIVDVDVTVSSDDVSILQIDKNGTIKMLGSYDGLPSDENFLNNSLAEFNEDFVKLMEIEELCR